MRLFCIVVLEQEFLWSSVGVETGSVEDIIPIAALFSSSLGAGLSAGLSSV